MDGGTKGTTSERKSEPAAKQRRGPGKVARLIPWIFGALVGVGLIWLFTNIVDAPNPSPLKVDTLQAPNLTGGDSLVEHPEVTTVDHVAGFVRFAEQDPAARVGSVQIYTGDGLARLAASLEALSGRFKSDDAEVAPRLARLRDYAGNIRRNAGASANADTVRRAFELAADLMSDLQQRNFPQAGPPVAELQRIARTLLPDRPLSDQTPAVERYFRQAGTALKTMVGAGG